jgi:hypothetical protein
MKTRDTQSRCSLHWMVSWHYYDGGFWLRIMGRGISVVNKQKHLPLFSERNGYRRVRRIGKWGVEWLPANDQALPEAGRNQAPTL